MFPMLEKNEFLCDYQFRGGKRSSGTAYNAQV